jgi:glycerol-3-phosphate dehydrogenase
VHRERLASAYLYYDAAVDDARLVLTVARTAAAHGAAVANRCSVVAMTHDTDGQVDGAVVEADDRRISVRARTVVNAAGVWADDVRALHEGSHPDSIRPAKGVHITVPWEKVRCDIAVVIPVPKDRRSLFLVPWGPLPDGTFQHAYIGTTDSDYDGPLDEPQCTQADIEYVLRAVNASLTTNVTADDITGVWAGLRPLVKAEASGRTADLSRNHSLHRSAHGLLTITGGKLTTYRDMAEDTVDAVLEELGRSARCRTKRLSLLGAVARRRDAIGTTAAHLRSRFGSMADEVEAIAAADSALRESLVDGLPYLCAEAVYAARHEMATTVDDVMSRRTRALLLDRAAARAAAPRVAHLLAVELGWDADETERQVQQFLAICDRESAAATESTPA